MNHRGFTIGPGHRRDGPRLPAVEPRCQQREPAMGRRVGQDRDPAALLWRESEPSVGAGQYRDGAAGCCIGGEIATVLLGAPQCGE
jgi:hypothetical protein